jgi:NAD(P)-dependent dehydrogenase (short-subunit alcohol dehydrogenase family)
MEVLGGQVAVVTGGASGIGAATAGCLAASGATVVTWDVAEGADIQCDVADPDSVSNALGITVATRGVPTILVAAAGVVSLGPLLEVTPDEWNRLMNVNLRGPFLCIQAVAREMIARSLPGAMVLISSINGIVADPELAQYSVSKAGSIHLARVAARELGQFRIRVNAICPGPTRTAMLAPVLQNDAFRNMLVDATPLGRLGRPEDIAEAICGILSMHWVTGQVISADGGIAHGGLARRDVHLEPPGVVP